MIARSEQVAVWFRRVLWLGIVANLALAMPTLIAPGAVDGAGALPTGDAADVAAVFGAAADSSEPVLHAGGRRCRSLPPGGVAGGRLPARRRGVLRRLSAGRIPHVRVLRSGLPRARGDPADHASQSHAGRRTSATATRRHHDDPARRAAASSAASSSCCWSSIGGVFAYVQFFREEPAPYFASDEDHFLFGSVGTEARAGHSVLDLAGAAAHFSGVSARPGRLRLARHPRQGRPRDADRLLEGHGRLPARRHQLRDVPHGQLRRERPAIRRRSSPAAPSHQTGEQEYLRFLFACASDPRFTADTILGEIAKNHRLSLRRSAALPLRHHPGRAGAAAAAAAATTRGWTIGPSWGRGRIDPFNPVKFTVLKQPIDDDHRQLRHGAAVEPEARASGTAYHWDGLNTTLQEVVLSSAHRRRRDDASGSIATMRSGTTPTRRTCRACGGCRTTSATCSRRSIRSRSTQRSPPRARRSSRGACATCHAMRRRPHRHGDSARGDRHRPPSPRHVDAGVADRLQRLRRRARLEVLRTSGQTAGYVVGAARRPLAACALPAQRLGADAGRPARAGRSAPKQFWRGYDVYDPVNVGFVSTGPEAERVGTFFDRETREQQRRHRYGTDLPAQQTRAD